MIERRRRSVGRSAGLSLHVSKLKAMSRAARFKMEETRRVKADCDEARPAGKFKDPFPFQMSLS